MRRKKTIFIITTITLLLVTIIASIGIVNANNLLNYALEIIDDGKDNLNSNAESSITKKIIEDNASNFVYEVGFKNTKQDTSPKEVAILIDTSKSMGINDEQSEIKQKASELVEAIFDNVNQTLISVSDIKSIKYNMADYTHKDLIKNTIEGLEIENGTQIDEGIRLAQQTFSIANSKKYLIIFTDATDPIEEVQNLESDGIEVITVLTNMTRESYGANEESTIGKQYMLDSFDSEKIYRQINNSIYNIEITDIFSEEISNYFDFEIVSKREKDEIEETDNGYIWKIKDLGGQETVTFRFRLTLKAYANIDSGKVYRNINTSENTKVQYYETGEIREYDVAESPIIVICEKYSMTLQAVSEENSELPVDDIDINVIGKDDNGKVVYEETLKTDRLGKIEIKELKTLGKITFTITPQVDKIGYSYTSPTEIILLNDATGKGLSLETDGLESSIDNVKRNLFAKLPINTKRFEVEVNLSEKNNSNIKIGDTEFRLIQPKLNSKYDLNALYATTDENGKLTFAPTIMTKKGTYDYILTQITERDDYEPLGNATLKITFDENGKIKENGVQVKHNNDVEAQRVNDSYIKINTTNTSIKQDTFKLEVDLKDEITSNVIEGAVYTVEATRENGVTTKYTGNKTDKNGRISLDIPGSGYIQIKIKEELPKVGYAEDKEEKELIVYRNEGNVQFVARTVPSNLKTVVDTFGNKVRVELNSKMNTELSSIQVQLADIQENDIYVPNVRFTLTSPLTGETYTGITNEEGIINFLVQGQQQGIYPYILTVDQNSIPLGYSNIQDNIEISVTFNQNRVVEDVSDIKGPIYRCEKIEYTENDKTYHTAYVGVGLDINEADSYNFKIKLRDEESLANIDGASYDIKITTGDIVRNIKSRKTDSEGNISTRLLPTDTIEIEVQETKSKPGYVIDDQIQLITLRKINGAYQVVSQEPYDYTDGKKGAIISNRDIIYYHTNRKKSGTDTKLNLYINKMDKEENLIANLPIKIYSDTLKAKDGSPLEVETMTDEFGYIEIEKIQVPEMNIPGEREDFLYIVEMQGDAQGNKIEKQSSLVKVKLTFRYNENKAIIELTNAESTWGNRLIKRKTFNGYETSEAYESNVYFDIYGNYDDVGNFSMDFIKKNRDDMQLYGAKYDIIVSRPDGTKLVRKGLEITDRVEFEGIIVSRGTTIEITESEAPIGYEVNGYTDIITIKDVSETGEVIAEVSDSSYDEARTIIKSTQLVQIDDENAKTCIEVELIDKELSTFKLGITTKDSVSKLGISDATYRLSTSKGAQGDTKPSDQNGNSQTLIGGNFVNETVEYKITQLKTGEYYKKLNTPIKLYVVFDENKEVDAEKTMNANSTQTDSNYQRTWQIISINEGTDISLEILNDPQDKLNVEIQTVDNITSNVLKNVTYKITPSINLSGEGSEKIEIGYVSPNATKIYTMTQTNEIETHRNMTPQTIKIAYDKDGNIVGTPEVTGSLELISSSGKTIIIKNKLEPKVPFIVENIAYFGDNPIDGARFEISGDNDEKTIETGLDGIGNELCGILGENEDIIYHVKQVKTPEGYASIDDFDIKVHYNENRSIDNVEFVTENRFVELSYITPSTPENTGYNGNDKGIVKIKVKSYPELKMNIENIDRLVETTKLAGTKYSVESTINTRDDEVITNEDGIGIAHLDKTAISERVTYTIKETRPSALYQTIEQDVKIDVVFDSEGFINKCEVIQGQTFATVSKIEDINTPEENFILNVQIKNNKILKFNITATDNVDHSYLLRDLEFTAKAELNDKELSIDKVTTDINGQGMLKLDKCLASEKIIYTIKQTKKNAGYQFPPEDMKIEITFDSDGKLITDSVRILQGSGYIQITNIDSDEFSIDIKVVNEEIQQFGVNITTIDKYDDTIKLKDINYDAYLLTSNYAKDENYTGNTITDENGEGYIQFDKYVGNHDEYATEEGEVRTLRLDETNVPDTHRPIRASILVNIKFDTNGVIQDVSVPGGLNAYVGWVADGRFVVVTHTRYTVCVTIKHYPYLKFNLLTEDIYTGDKLAAKYRISTHYGPGGYYQNADTKIMEDKILDVQDKVYQTDRRNATLEDLIQHLAIDTSVTLIKNNIDIDGTVKITINNVYVYTINTELQITNAQGPWYSSGGTTGYTSIDYIGNGYGEFLEAYYETTTDGEYDKRGVGPTEQSTLAQTAIRDFYIYELEEPSSPIQYQKYRPRYESWYYSKIIGKIKVTYDDKGRIEKWAVEDLRSNNNIDEGFIEVDKIDGYNLEVKVKYAPITEMEVTAIDSISRAPLSNIRVSPYMNPEFQTRTSYEYRTIGYYTTDKDGKTNYTYWGANINEGQNEYHMDTSLMGYNGYFDTGLVKIKVAYDEYGRISGADVLSTDENGMPNAEIAGFENNKLKVNLLYYRKFNIKVNKADVYDGNIKLTAAFDISSSKGDLESINSSELRTVGMIRPGETVKYTLSETLVPQGYIPMENLEFFVSFNDDGTVEKSWSDNELFELFYARKEVDITRPATVKDLEVNIKNEPRFTVKLNLFDKFYNEKKLPNVTFSMKNSKGDIALGNPITDKNGLLETYIGPVYKNETVTYTIEQTSQINGYKEDKIITELEVEFNENAKIKDYRIISGEEFIEIDVNKYQNQRYVEIDAKATPKDLKLGIINYDSLTNEPMPNVTYKVTTQEIVSGSSTKVTELTTNSDGMVVDVVDEFKERDPQRVVNYTISEITIPNTYRKIQDIVLQVRYNEDGSMQLRNVISNPSNVNIKVALGGKLQYAGTEDVHILLEIPNNNTYDLVIKDEDKNFKDLGIQGTIYDISINGETLSGTTNENGNIEIKNRTDKGNIQIRIAENAIGLGYKQDINNDTTININKGEEEYSLTLDSNSNPDFADVTVDEEYGVITVIFKNETKSSLTLIKDETDLRYKITAKEKDSNGNYSNEIEIGTDVNDDIAKEILHYDLGVTPQNKVIVYTFEEISLKGDYHKSYTFEVTVEFDIYGRIKNIADNSYRVDAIESPERSNDIIVIVSNEEREEDEYTVKIVSQDINNNKRINESIFDINISTNDNNIIKDLRGVVTGDISNKGYITEKGVIKINGLKEEGNIYIDVNQTNPAKGYIYGKQKTSGTVTMQVTYNDTTDLEKRIPTIVLQEDDGFDVSVDNTNKEITIKVNNEPQVMMQITSQLKTKDENGNNVYIPQEGIHYTITSEVQLTSSSSLTELNVTTKATDEQGKTEIPVGTPYVGKTVLYTISQEESEDYIKIEDIIALVQYDTKGNIKYYEILSNADDAQVTGKIGEREILLEITNTQNQKVEDYKIVIEKTHINNEEYGRFIPGVKFRIQVKQEYGKEITEWEEITNEDGIIISNMFNGYGNIEINVTELEAGEGFKLDGETKTIRFIRDKNTGKLNIITTDINYDWSREGEEYKTIYLRPINEQKSDLHTIVINKVDKNTNRLITDSSAEFDVTQIVQEYQETVKEPDAFEGNPGTEQNLDINDESSETEQKPDVTEEEKTIVEIPYYIGKVETDKNGKARIENMKSPKEPGTYKYIINETRTPEGYIGSEEIILELTFDYDNQENIVISDAKVLNGDASILSKKGGLINIIINNEKQSDIIKDGEYKLDINKIDGETKESIESQAVFKMNLPNGKTMYSETSTETTGKLDKFYLETDAEEKIDLKHLVMPDSPKTETYTITEVVAPQGYSKIEEELKINVEFDYDDNGKITIKDCTVEGNSIELVDIEDKKIIINILNYLEEKDKYIIHYNANDKGKGTEVPEDQTKEKDVDLVLDTMKLSRTGYKFIGWSTNKEAKEAEYQPGDIYIENEHTTLYAVWEANKYIITFNPGDDATIDKDTKEVTYDEEYGELPIPIKPGYEFEGWYDSDGNKVESTDIVQITEDTTLTAKYTLTTYTIEYKDLRGSDNSENPSTYTVEDENIQLVDLPNQENLIFKGWYTTNDDAGIKVNSIDTSKLENIILYARWEDDGNDDKDKLYLKSDVYTIKDDIVSRVNAETTVSTFVDNLISNATTLIVYDKVGNELDDNSLVGTEMYVVATKDDEQIICKISVVGDLNGDGLITIVDVSRIKSNYLGTVTIPDFAEDDITVKLYELSADINNDQNINIVDVSKLKSHYLGVQKIY